jgi:hypothetical protein
MTPERRRDVPATIALQPGGPSGLLALAAGGGGRADFEGGGRFTCELTDVDPATVKIGDRVEMTFRRLMTAHDA